MAMVTVNFRMDEELKKAMEKVCEELGMNMTTAFMIYAKKMTREHRIPFEVSCSPHFGIADMTREQLNDELKKGADCIAAGKCVSAEKFEADMERFLNDEL